MTDGPLIEWARRFQTTHPGTPRQLRERLEATLVPMIRSAIGKGLGQPSLVHWVREQLPPPSPGAPEDVAGLAGPLARRLCERLLTHLTPAGDRETVCGA